MLKYKYNKYGFMLIIYAHPNKKGHSGYILAQIENSLKQKKIDYEILDLYKMNYDPVLKNDEHYTSGGYNISPANKKIQEKIKNNSSFIFIYPIWWNNMPAILKGFIDRVFTPQFAFIYQNKLPRGLLKNKKAAIITSTGAPRLLTRLYYQDRGIKILTKDVLKFCEVKARGFVVDRAAELSDNQKNKISKRVHQALSYLLS
jgi:NAD(P)H dehydrogenase (quinone)